MMKGMSISDLPLSPMEIDGPSFEITVRIQDTKRDSDSGKLLEELNHLHLLSQRVVHQAF